jgi:hypothetical protein
MFWRYRFRPRGRHRAAGATAQGIFHDFESARNRLYDRPVGGGGDDFRPPGEWIRWCDIRWVVDLPTCSTSAANIFAAAWPAPLKTIRTGDPPVLFGEGEGGSRGQPRKDPPLLFNALHRHLGYLRRRGRPA